MPCMGVSCKLLYDAFVFLMNSRYWHDLWRDCDFINMAPTASGIHAVYLMFYPDLQVHGGVHPPCGNTWYTLLRQTLDEWMGYSEN